MVTIEVRVCVVIIGVRWSAAVREWVLLVAEHPAGKRVHRHVHERDAHDVRDELAELSVHTAPCCG